MPQRPYPPKDHYLPKGPYFPITPLKHRACHPPTTSTVSPQIIASAHALRHIQSPTSSKTMPLKHHQSSHFIPQDTPPKHMHPASITLLSSFMPLTHQNTVPYPPHKYPAPNPPAHGPLRHHLPKPLPSITSAYKHDSLRFNPLKIGNHQSIPLPRHHPTSSTST